MNQQVTFPEIDAKQFVAACRTYCAIDDSMARNNAMHNIEVVSSVPEGQFHDGVFKTFICGAAL